MKKIKKKKNYLFIVIIGMLTIFLLYYFFNNNSILDNLKGISANTLKINNNYDDVVLEIDKELEKNIKELKEINKIDKLLSDSVIINAVITKRSTPYWHNYITINKGKKDGVKKGYGVIDSYGLIGEVVIVNNRTSEVKLITNTDNNYITCKFNYKGTDYYGNIKRYNIIKNQLYMENVIGDFSKKDIENIDVVTSGLSSNIPSGILIGKIIDIKKDNYNLSNRITISLNKNINDINIVKVVGKK